MRDQFVGHQAKPGEAHRGGHFERQGYPDLRRDGMAG